MSCLCSGFKSWQPKSRRGQFLGRSRARASDIGLIMNLQNGRVSKHFHIAYDNFCHYIHIKWHQHATRFLNETSVENRGQFLGRSRARASDIGLIRNLQNGRVSKHFHIVYDNFCHYIHIKWHQHTTRFLNKTSVENPVQNNNVAPILDDSWLDYR